METTAEEVDGGYVLNGAKTWISNAPVALVPCLVVCAQFSELTFYRFTAIYLLYGRVVNGTTKCEDS